MMTYGGKIESIEDIEREERARNQYIVRAPLTPGAVASAQPCASLESARMIADKFASRRDLRHQDVRIEWADSGRLIEYAGPLR